MIDVALMGQVLVWLLAIGIFMWSRQASVFHPAMVYLAFHGLVFVLRPILVYYFGFNSSWEYMGFKPSEEVFIRTLEVSSLAMICLVGACLMMGRVKTQFTQLEPPSFTLPQKRALLATTLLLIPLIAYSIYATRNGVEGDRVNGIYIMTNSTGYINEAQEFIMPLLVIWMLVTRFHWLNIFPALLYVAYRSWFGWSRWTILLFFILVVMAYCWRNRRKWLPLWSILAAIPIILLFNVIGHNRDLVKSWITGEDAQVTHFHAGMTLKDKLKVQFDGPDFANFDFLSYIIWDVPFKTETYSFGSQYVQLFTEPIPRILWKGKPVGSPVRSINMFEYANFVGLTVSLAGDGWISGGWVGVILELTLVGGLLGLAHRKFWMNSDNATGCILYLILVAIIPQWYRDGGISIAKFMLFNFTPVFIWMGMTWMMAGSFLPGYTVQIPAGTRIRVIQPGARQESIQ